MATKANGCACDFKTEQAMPLLMIKCAAFPPICDIKTISLQFIGPCQAVKETLFMYEAHLSSENLLCELYLHHWYFPLNILQVYSNLLTF